MAGAIILLGCIYLLWTFRGMWFFGDEWAVIATRRDLWSQGARGEALFRPHTDHWVTLPILSYFVLFKLFALTSYLPYLATVIVAHGLTSFGLHELLRRMGVGRIAALGGLTLFTLYGAGGENLSWGFQVTIVASIGFGIAQLLVVTSPSASSPTHQILGPLAGALNIITSGMAVPMLAGVAVALMLQRKYRVLVSNIGFPFILYACWYLTYGNDPHAKIPSRPEWFVSYVERGIFASLEAATRLNRTGALLFVVLAACAAKWWPRRQHNPLPLVGLVVGFGMYGLFAIGRTGLGPEQAAQSRYLYASAAVLIGPLLLAPSALLSNRSLGKVVVAGVLGWSVIGNVSELTIYRDKRIIENDHTRQRIQYIAGMPTAPDLVRNARVEPEYSPDLLVGTLVDFVRDGQLPVVQIEPFQGTIDREVELSLTLAPLVDPVDGPLADDRLEPDLERILRSGCVDTSGSPRVVVLPIQKVGTFSVRRIDDEPRPSPVDIQLRRGGLTSKKLPISFTDQDVQKVNVATTDAEILLTFPGQAFEVCGINDQD